MSVRTEGQAGGSHRMGWRRITAISLAAVLVAGGAVAIGFFATHAPTSVATALPGATTAPGASATHSPGDRPTPTDAARPAPTASPTPIALVPRFDKTARSHDDPTSIWVVVDKDRPLQPADYTPPDLVAVPVPHVWEPQLRREASDAVVALFAAFTAETGLQLQSQSSYRSYPTQVSVYNDDVSAHGQAVADTSTARPGTSEHQTGLAIDISALPSSCSLEACFGATPQGTWLAHNAWKYGFLLRYPEDKVAVTGYAYEPWHFRYIGIDLATEMHTEGVTTLEEFFGLPAAPTYH